MRFLTVLFLLVFAGTVVPKTDSASISLADTMYTDTLRTDTPHTDTLHSARLYIDTTSHDQKGAVADSLAATNVAAKVESPDKNRPLLIKRTYESKSQVRVGIAMMIFIGVIFFTAQSLNP